MSANDHQVGGTHYASGYQHWDWVLTLKLSYLEGNATRYISRWRKKEWLQDLKKALHYVHKLAETLPSPRHLLDASFRQRETIRFADANGLTPQELSILLAIVLHETKEDLLLVAESIEQLMVAADAAVPLEDSNKHAERA